MEQLTRTTKSIIFERIKELELCILQYEKCMEDSGFNEFDQFTKVEIEMMEMQITFLKEKLFN